MDMNEAKRDEFKRLTKPVICFIAEHLNPHAKIIVTSISAEALLGEIAYETHEYVDDKDYCNWMWYDIENNRASVMCQDPSPVSELVPDDMICPWCKRRIVTVDVNWKEIKR